MNAKVVVSCPECLRQYQIDSANGDGVAQCHGCDSHFAIVISRLTGPTEPTVVLEKELDQKYEFFMEACEAAGRHACNFLRKNDSLVTIDRIKEMIRNMTSDKACDHFTVWVNSSDRLPDDEDAEYFAHTMPKRSRAARLMLVAAFAGVLGGIDWRSVHISETLAVKIRNVTDNMVRGIVPDDVDGMDSPLAMMGESDEAQSWLQKLTSWWRPLK